MEKKIDEIRDHIVEIKLDLREHMKRTEYAEEKISILKQELTPVRKAYIGIKWSMGAIVLAGAVFSALAKFIVLP